MSFALERSGIPPIREIRLENKSGITRSGLTLSVSSSPAFFREKKYTIDRLAAHSAYELPCRDLAMLPNYLIALADAVEATVSLLLYDGDALLCEHAFSVSLLPYDSFAGLCILPETAAAHILPNHPYVAELVKSASTILRHWSKGAALRGYADREPSLVRGQMNALFAALECEKIALAEPPAPYRTPGAPLRSFDKIREEKCATPLELSFLYAACLEAIGLFPLLVFEAGYVYAGAWLLETHFSECIQDDATQLSKRTAEGVNELLLVDAAAGTDAALSFDAACTAADARLAERDRFAFALDVRRARASGIAPMPRRRLDAKGNVIFDFQAKAPAASTEGEGLPPRRTKHTPTELSKIKLWERKLLDLSLGNPLLNFRPRRGAIRLFSASPEELFRSLTDGGEFSILPAPKELDAPPPADGGIADLRPLGASFENLLRTEHRQARLRSDVKGDALPGALTALYRSAKSSLEESGANTLYLAFGMLRWYESDSSQKAHHAPLLLLPVELCRTSVTRDFILRAREEEPQFNITLLEQLRAAFGTEPVGVDPLPTEGGRVDMRAVFTAVRQAVMRLSRFDIIECVFLANFSFANFIMYHDLRRRSEELAKNRVVAGLISGKPEFSDPEPFLSPRELDERVSPADMAAPLPADSSQLSAIHAAGLGKTFVLHGPPGTGKSQTITNMISNALYHGKTVLFIAEKMAALSVVQKRLEAIGLAPFCLELHSNKAKKKDVLAQLDRTLTGAKVKEPAAYASEAERLRRLRESLSSTMKRIHRPRNFGMSLYEAIVLFEDYKSAPEIKVYDEMAVKGVSADSRREAERLLERLRAASLAAGGAVNNPFSIFCRYEYSQAIKTEFGDALRAFVEAADTLQKNLVALARILPLRNLHTYLQIHSVAELCRILSVIELLPDGLVTNKNIILYREKVLEICRAGQRRDELAKSLTERFTEQVLAFDAEQNLRRLKLAQSKGPIGGMIRRRKIRARLFSFGRVPKPCRAKETGRVLEDILEYQNCARTVRENSQTCEFIFGNLFARGRCDFAMLERVFTTATEVVRLIGEICTSPENRQLMLVKIGALTDEGLFAERKSLFTAVSDSFDTLARAEVRMAELGGCDTKVWHMQQGWLLRQRANAEFCRTHIDTLRDRVSYLIARREAEEAGLGALTSALEAGSVKCDELLPAYRRALAYACASFVIDSDDTLSTFSGVLLETQIGEYAEVAREFSDLTKQELAAMLSAKIPDPMTGASTSSEIAILQRAIRSGGRGLSIRKLFDSIPNLLRSLAPCMLMSPISVAQYIDPAAPKYDLVIFDEASQLPTCEAVGAIARGEHLIVVGDPNQLPPTDFFTVTREDSENLEREDLDSILDDCLALGLPEEHLLWHYRSRHESLIAFSNRQYYGNRLYTFPSPNDRVSRVRLIPVEGYYDRGRSKTNRAEAEAVIAEIKRRLLDPQEARKSIGVVTFSSVQQVLIEDMLDRELARDARLEGAAHAMHEPIFVKNLENVQGDERDVIMFSVCYGPDKRGEVTMNFGPLNREGGWRRLNVAASRARLEMLVFSSLSPDAIDPMRTNADGVRGLRAFLEFASSGSPKLPARPGDAHEPASIRESVAKSLTELGYTCDTSVGCSAYKIDIAIRDPLREGEYLLGILCDSAASASGTTAHDRLVLQDSVLSGLGWKIYHLWALDWWDSPAKELERIKALAEEARLRPVVPDAPAPALDNTTVFELVEEGETPEDTPEVYTLARLAPLPTGLSGLDAFCDPINKTRIVMQIDLILRKEAPISRTTLTRRLLAHWGINRVSPRIERTLSETLGFVDMTTTGSATKSFFWLTDPTGEVPFRVPNKDDPKTRRDIDDIPLEELASAIVYIVRHQYSLTVDDLGREVAKLLGFTRLSPSMQQPITDALKYATDTGRVNIKDGRVTIR